MSERDDFEALERVHMQAHARSEAAKLRMLDEIVVIFVWVFRALMLNCILLICVVVELARR